MEHKVRDEVLTTDESLLLLKIARESLQYYLKTGSHIEYDESVLPDNLNLLHGVFVSLYKGNALRGCIGRLKPDLPLYKLVQRMTISAATGDNRFSSVKYGELGQIRIEISVLSELTKVSDPKQIELGKHGILIRKDSFAGTFLPQVAIHTGWDLEEFLGHCSRDKAGIGWEGWKDAEIFIYTADVIRE